MKKNIISVFLLAGLFIICPLIVAAHGQRMRGKSPFDRDDYNKDGKLTPKEFRGSPQEFERLDRDGDGFITRQEEEESRSRKQSRNFPKQKKQYQVQKGPGELVVDIWQKDKACNGTTLLAVTHPENPRIVEVDMQGRVVWEYKIPDFLRNYISPGLDVELLPNDNILILFPRNGVYEINRNGDIVWKYLDNKISHDADRLKNGNTIFVWGGGDKKDDAQVKEVDSSGKTVWEWKAKKDFDKEPYRNIEKGGWTHTNAVTRLENGNTIICLRNFYLTVEVNPKGEPVWLYDWSLFGKNVDPHEPEILPNDNMLIAIQNDAPYQAVEIKRGTGETVWKFSYPGLRTTRDADRLPNGNTLLVGVLKGEEESVIFEVAPDGEIVWKLGLKNAPAKRGDKRAPGWFYKAERIPERKK